MLAPIDHTMRVGPVELTGPASITDDPGHQQRGHHQEEASHRRPAHDVHEAVVAPVPVHDETHGTLLDVFA